MAHCSSKAQAALCPVCSPKKFSKNQRDYLNATRGSAMQESAGFRNRKEKQEVFLTLDTMQNFRKRGDGDLIDAHKELDHPGPAHSCSICRKAALEESRIPLRELNARAKLTPKELAMRSIRKQSRSQEDYAKNLEKAGFKREADDVWMAMGGMEK